MNAAGSVPSETDRKVKTSNILPSSPIGVLTRFLFSLPPAKRRPSEDVETINLGRTSTRRDARRS